MIYSLNDGYLDRKELDDIRRVLPKDIILREMACFYSVFSDCTRMKILSALSVNELCVNDLATVLEINQSTVSHQLKLMRDLGMVDYRRKGKMVFYYVANPLVNDVMMLGSEGLDTQRAREVRVKNFVQARL